MESLSSSDSVNSFYGIEYGIREVLELQAQQNLEIATKEKLAFQLALDVNNAKWKCMRSICGNGYDENSTALLLNITLCGGLAMKNTEDGDNAAWQIARLVALFVCDPEFIRDHFDHRLRTGADTDCNVRPEDHAADQTQLNAFVLRAFAQYHGLRKRLRQMICRVQNNNQVRCYSPSDWERRWPWVLKNIFDGDAE